MIIDGWLIPSGKYGSWIRDGNLIFSKRFNTSSFISSYLGLIVVLNGADLVVKMLVFKVFLAKVWFRGRFVIEVLTTPELSTFARKLVSYWNTHLENKKYSSLQFTLPQAPPDMFDFFLDVVLTLGIGNLLLNPFWRGNRLVGFPFVCDRKLLIFLRLYCDVVVTCWGPT